MIGFGNVVLGLLFLAPPAIQQGMHNGTLPSTAPAKCQVVLEKAVNSNYYTEKVIDDGKCS